MDKEELRADKAVKVTKKELNDLMAELFEFADNYDQSLNKKSAENDSQKSILVSETQITEKNLESQNSTISNVSIEVSYVENMEVDSTVINDKCLKAENGPQVRIININI